MDIHDYDTGVVVAVAIDTEPFSVKRIVKIIIDVAVVVVVVVRLLYSNLLRQRWNGIVVEPQYVPPQHGDHHDDDVPKTDRGWISCGDVDTDGPSSW
jgi:hypothetical protein